MIPWRVKNFMSQHFPLLYHVVVNRGVSVNDLEHWDRRLEATWDLPALVWPTKNQLIAARISLTESILDVGCGNGSILKYLRSQDYQYLEGVEMSQYAVRRLREEGLEIHEGRLLDIGLPERSYDIIIASQILEHVIRRRRFVEEICRLLKPKGRAFFFVPDDTLGPIDEKQHVIKYTRTSLARFLSGHFKVVQVENFRDVNHETPILFACCQESRLAR